MRAVIATAAAVGISLFTTAAVAQEEAAAVAPAPAPVAAGPASTFGRQWTFVISAERLLGLSFTNDKEDNFANTEETKTTATEFGFSAKPLAANPYFLPQLGADIFVIDKLSVGLGLTYWHLGGEETTRPPPMNEPATQQLDDSSLFRVTPRIGFGMMFTDVVGLWARGGISYYNRHAEAENGDERTEDGVAVTVEGLLMLSPINHVAFSIGPVVDFGLTGEDEDNPADPAEPTDTRDVRRTQYGLLAGLHVWF